MRLPDWLRHPIFWVRQHDVFYLTALSVVVGVLAGCGALAFRFGIGWISQQWVGAPGWGAVLYEIPWYIFLLAPLCGGLLVGCINTWWLEPDAIKIVPGVMEALALHGGKIRLRKAAGETVSNMVALGSGASMGREAPTVALGAAIASLLGQALRMNEQQMRVLIGCGVAAAIAASFNAPIAGALFALEVILTDYTIATFSPIVLAAVIATVITRATVGNFPAFVVPHFFMDSYLQIPSYLLLGVLCGLLAALMIFLLPRVRGAFERHVPNTLIRPAVAGVMLGLLALLVPELMSMGYGTVSALLNRSFVPHLLGMSVPLIPFLLLLLPMKLTTSLICAGGGFGTGLIGPSLFLGTTAGALFGAVVHGLFPQLTGDYGSYALIGAGAMMAAALQAPVSTILMLFELSGEYRIMVPLMTACVGASLVKLAFGRDSIFTEILSSRGIETRWGMERAWLRSVPVTSIPWRAVPKVPADARLSALKREYVASGKGCVQVVDEKGLMIGIVTFHDLKEWLLDSALDEVVVASEVANRNVKVVSEDASLLDAISVLDREEFEQMPVVAADEPRRVLGMLSRNAVFSTYHKLIVQHGEVALKA
ncbi:MAG: chloride channel protein [Zetaproteobacteria bacterium]|nr:MAG: chloride channel protein [Zetaproteobacteria bacterium]